MEIRKLLRSIEVRPEVLAVTLPVSCLSYVAGVLKEGQRPTVKGLLTVGLFGSLVAELTHLLNSVTQSQGHLLAVDEDAGKEKHTQLNRAIKPNRDVVGMRELLPYLHYITNIGTDFSASMLLWGLPGTGKSMVPLLVRQYLSEHRAFFTHKQITCVDDIRSARQRLTWEEVFFFAEIDEIDRLFDTCRDVREKETLESELRRFLDDMQQRGNALVVATTNHPEKLSDAIKRPGRFDYCMEVPPWTRAAAEWQLRRVSWLAPGQLEEALAKLDELMIDYKGEPGYVLPASIGVLIKQVLLGIGGKDVLGREEASAAAKSGASPRKGSVPRAKRTRAAPASGC